MYKNKIIAVVIPCYKVSKSIKYVVSLLPKFIDKIYLISDGCPENSLNQITSKSKKIIKIFRKKNGGVGAAVKDGYISSLKDNNDITVRIDGDGQMNPKLISKFIDPIIDGKAEFTKGNRFKDLSFIRKMPFLRIIGNIFFSLMGNIHTKNMKIFDLLNGYTCISNNSLKKVITKKLDNDYFFETSFILYLSRMKIKMLDIKMSATYKDEKSNMNILSTGFTIFFKNLFFIFRK